MVTGTSTHRCGKRRKTLNPIPSTEQSSVSIWVSTISLSPRRAGSGRQTSSTTGTESTRNGVVAARSVMDHEKHENIERIGRKAEGRFTIYLHTVANGHSRGGRERVFAHRVRGPNPHQENIPNATWQHQWAFRRLYGYVEYKSRRTWPGGRAGQPAQHVEAMLDVWVYPRRESPPGVVRVPAVWVRKPRGLQRFEEYRLAVSPSSAKRRRWRRTRRRALESRDAEREWGLRTPCLNRGIERESTRKPHPQRAGGSLDPERKR